MRYEITQIELFVEQPAIIFFTKLRHTIPSTDLPIEYSSVW